MINIGIDIMGGDYAPHTTLEGVVLALDKINPTSQLVLIGDEHAIRAHLERVDFNSDQIQIVPSTEVIEMTDHPIKALQQKKNSSMSIGFGLLAKEKIHAFASAGHSGAVMIGAMHSVKQIEGVWRPCVATAFPLPTGQKNVLLDVGINVDCKPEMLVQFAKLGSVYAKQVFGIEAPRVGLLNTGAEETKGSLLYQQAHELLKLESEINFVGNLEARDFFDGNCDVTVCDGFTGNVMLKQTEAFYKLLQSRGIQDDYLDLFNYEHYGGTPVLGVNGNVLLGHGISNGNAICNMILAAEKVAEADLAAHIKKAFI
jgi:glycerol-3-phosphate acyltransferase PlsX